MSRAHRPQHGWSWRWSLLLESGGRGLPRSWQPSLPLLRQGQTYHTPRNLLHLPALSLWRRRGPVRRCLGNCSGRTRYVTIWRAYDSIPLATHLPASDASSRTHDSFLRISWLLRLLQPILSRGPKSCEYPEKDSPGQSPMSILPHLESPKGTSATDISHGNDSRQNQTFCDSPQRTTHADTTRSNKQLENKRILFTHHAAKQSAQTGASIPQTVFMPYQVSNV